MRIRGSERATPRIYLSRSHTLSRFGIGVTRWTKVELVSILQSERKKYEVYL